MPKSVPVESKNGCSHVRVSDIITNGTRLNVIECLDWRCIKRTKVYTGLNLDNRRNHRSSGGPFFFTFSPIKERSRILYGLIGQAS